MRNRTLLGLFAALVLLVAGCGAQHGRTIVTASPNTTPMQTAPESGRYMLYTAMSPNPTMTVDLQKGDRLGFEKSDDGRIRAIAGNQERDLGKMTAQAYWKLEK